MDIFKVKSSILSISEENYMKVTGRQPPYSLKTKQGEESFFALCPECENPIQLIGLYKNTLESGTKPYGRHACKDIPDLATHNQADYYDCSYSDPKWKSPAGKRSLGSRIAHKVFQLIRDEFDRVIYVLSKDIQVWISYASARAMLECYIANEGWLYRTATMNNLPWVFGLAQPAIPLYGRLIVRDSELHRAIEEKCPGAVITDCGNDKYVKVTNKDGCYLTLHYLLMSHKKQVIAEHLTETIELWVYYGSAPDFITVYKTTIDIRTGYFQNLIQLPEERSRRNEGYLRIAEELLVK